MVNLNTKHLETLGQRQTQKASASGGNVNVTVTPASDQRVVVTGVGYKVNDGTGNVTLAINEDSVSYYSASTAVTGTGFQLLHVGAAGEAVQWSVTRSGLTDGEAFMDYYLI